jgi:hypothetical protein
MCLLSSCDLDLTEPVDIFADWIDSSEAASKLHPQVSRGPISPITPTAEASSSRLARNDSMADEETQDSVPRRRFVNEDSDDD